MPVGPGGPQVDNLAYVSVGLGAVSVIVGCCCFFLNVPFALGAIGLGIYSITQQNKNPMLTGKPFAIAGIALGGLGLAVVVLRLILTLAGVAGAGLTDILNQHH